jgi:hypothetical protein
MKNLIVVLLICIVISTLTTCKKNSDTLPVAKPTIQGLWHIVSDTDLFGVGNVVSWDTIVYKIVPGDYYNFASNGNLYINETNAGGRDTMNYAVLTDTTINVFYFQNNIQYQYSTFYVKALTNSSLAILSVQAGIFGNSLETMHFTR